MLSSFLFFFLKFCLRSMFNLIPVVCILQKHLDPKHGYYVSEKEAKHDSYSGNFFFEKSFMEPTV